MPELMKEYIGDAVYVHHDGYHIWLTTGDGNNQRIALEPAVWQGLMNWRMKLEAAMREQQNAAKD